MNLLLTIAKFFSANLILIHKGTLVTKLKSSVAIAAAFSPVAYIFEKIMHWTVENEQYVWFVFLAIMIDHSIGTILHLVKRDFSIKKNIVGVFTKIGLVVAMGFLFEGVNVLIEEDSFVKNYLIIVLRLTIFMYPAGSAFANSSILTNGKFPPVGWMNKLKKFQENLDIKEIKGETNN